MLLSSSFKHSVLHKQSSVHGKLFLLQEDLCVEKLVLHWHLTNSMMADGAGRTFVYSDWQHLTICVL